MIPAIRLVQPEFFAGWSLWPQAAIFLLVSALTVRPLCRAFGGVRWSPAALALAAAAPLAVWWLLPQREYHFAGHEDSYGDLLDGEVPELVALSGHGTYPLPAGIAWAMGKVAPRTPARTAWLLANRAALPLVLVCLGAAAARAGRRGRGEERPGEVADPGDARREKLAGLLGVAFGIAIVPLHGWSGTAFCVAPGLALALLVVLLGLAREPAAALAWGALAIGTRMESGPLLMGGLLAAGAGAWRTAVAPRRSLALAGAGIVLAWEAFLLSQKSAGIPLENNNHFLAGVVLENLRTLPLGGAWLAPGALALVALLAVMAPEGRGGRWQRLALGTALAAALLQPLGLVDLGARHLLNASCLLAILAADGCARLSMPGASRIGRVAAAVLSAWLVWRTAQDGRSLVHRYMAGEHAALPSWTRAADATGVRGPIDEVLDLRCYRVVPGGRSTSRGAHNGEMPEEIHRAALALGAGWCVQWATDDEEQFSGDTQAERLDRAIRTLGLWPVGWIDPPPWGERPWMLWEAGR